MIPVDCRVNAGLSGSETETAGTIAADKSADGDSLRITITRPDTAVTATLSRTEALTLLLTAADALGMVVFDPKDAARRTAKARQRRS
jgi:hypothetical protein